MVTRSKTSARRASLYKNITPIVIGEQFHRTEIIGRATSQAFEMGFLEPGYRLAVLEGEHTTREGLLQDGCLQVIRV